MHDWSQRSACGYTGYQGFMLSRQHVMDDMTVDIGQPEPAALVAKRKPFVIDAEQMQ